MVGNAPGKQQKRRQPHGRQKGRRTSHRMPLARLAQWRSRQDQGATTRMPVRSPSHQVSSAGPASCPDIRPSRRDRRHPEHRRHPSARPQPPRPEPVDPGSLPQVLAPDIAAKQPSPQNGFEGIARSDECRSDQKRTERAGPACQQDMQVSQECPQRHARPQAQASPAAARPKRSPTAQTAVALVCGKARRSPSQAVR